MQHNQKQNKNNVFFYFSVNVGKCNRKCKVNRNKREEFEKIDFYVNKLKYKMVPFKSDTMSEWNYIIFHKHQANDTLIRIASNYNATHFIAIQA